MRIRWPTPAATPYLYRLQNPSVSSSLSGVELMLAHGWIACPCARAFEQAVTGVLTDTDLERLRVAPEESWPEVREALEY
jgi:hypothetical protein